MAKSGLCGTDWYGQYEAYFVCDTERAVRDCYHTERTGRGCYGTGRVEGDCYCRIRWEVNSTVRFGWDVMTTVKNSDSIRELGEFDNEQVPDLRYHV